MENIKFLQITDDQTNQSAYYKKYKYWARSEVLTAVMMKNQVKLNTNLMQHCAGFISAGSLYMFRAQAPIIRSI